MACTWKATREWKVSRIVKKGKKGGVMTSFYLKMGVSFHHIYHLLSHSKAMVPMLLLWSNTRISQCVSHFAGPHHSMYAHNCRKSVHSKGKKRRKEKFRHNKTFFDCAQSFWESKVDQTRLNKQHSSSVCLLLPSHTMNEERGFWNDSFILSSQSFALETDAFFSSLFSFIYLCLPCFSLGDCYLLAKLGNSINIVVLCEERVLLR